MAAAAVRLDPTPARAAAVASVRLATPIRSMPARPSAATPAPGLPIQRKVDRADALPAFRRALAALAVEPAMARAAGPGLAPLRELLAGAFAALEAQAIVGGNGFDPARERGALADDLLLGLMNLAGATVDRRAAGIAPALDLLALGEYGRGRWAREPLALLLLLPDDRSARVRAERIAAFLRRCLSDLGIAVMAEIAPLGIVAGRIASTPNLRARLVHRRHLWGSTMLAKELDRLLGSM